MLKWEEIWGNRTRDRTVIGKTRRRMKLLEIESVREDEQWLKGCWWSLTEWWRSVKSKKYINMWPPVSGLWENPVIPTKINHQENKGIRFKPLTWNLSWNVIDLFVVSVQHKNTQPISQSGCTTLILFSVFLLRSYTEDRISTRPKISADWYYLADISIII